MVKLFVYTILAVAVGLVLTLVLAQEPGYLLISFGPYSFETSLFALFVVFLCLLVLWKIAATFLAWINPLRLFSKGRQWSLSRAQAKKAKPVKTPEQVQQEFIQGLVELSQSESLNTAELKKYWKKKAKQYLAVEAAVKVYAGILVSLEQYGEALDVIESSLKVTWNASLLPIYANACLHIEDSVAVKKMQKAESWLNEHGEDAQLLLALGRLSLRNELWGKAREYFERSLRKSNEPEAFAELARLLLNLREQNKSPDYLRLQTKLVSQSLPPFPQPTFDKAIDNTLSAKVDS
ncbi:MAG: hypothetical protein R3332_06105 [Pseudohongiellaceae bacterium]|nr:hypothetical protein [Pseudohongiellaceae bacterium]